MKRLKALVKMELKPALLMGIYFLLVNVVILLMINSELTSTWNGFLNYGIQRFVDYSGVTELPRLLNEGVLYAMLWSALGLIGLVYVSFKNDKSTEVGRFLKSLPYTMKERCLSKVGVGVSVFTISYWLFGIGMMLTRAKYMTQFGEIYQVTAYSNVYQDFLTATQLLKILVLGYVACVAIYLFLVMFQYIISQNLASIIVAVLVYLSPLFIMNSLSAYMTMSYDRGLFRVTEWINKLMMVFGYMDYYSISINYSDAHTMTSYSVQDVDYIGLIGWRLLFYVILAVISCVGILRLSQKNQIEQSDVFIPGKGFRIIFIIGVTICGGMLLGDLYSMYTNTLTHMGNYIVLIIGGGISFLVANKLTQIGRKKRKGVQV